MDHKLILFDRVEMIRTVITKYQEENFYLAFSGGKDSLVVHHLLDLALPGNQIPRVFINTGIEYDSLVELVKTMAKADKRFRIYPAGVNIAQMLEKKGYPFKSKEHSRRLKTFQLSGLCKSVQSYLTGLRGDNKASKFICPSVLKYQFDEGFNIKVSDDCCNQLKKNPSRRYEREFRKPIRITGLRTAEGGQRANRTECVVLDAKTGKLKNFKPINPCNDEFIDWFIEEQGIKLCELYYPPFNFKRTGCKGCPYSIEIQEQLTLMEMYLPNERKQCERVWEPVYKEYRRLGYRLDKDEQLKLF